MPINRNIFALNLICDSSMDPK